MKNVKTSEICGNNYYGGDILFCTRGYNTAGVGKRPRYFYRLEDLPHTPIASHMIRRSTFATQEDKRST